MKKINNYITEKLHITKDTGKDIPYTCHPKDRDELREILKERLAKDKNADLNDIDVSKITNMLGLFEGLDPHNIHIEDWNVSNVKDMSHMFYACINFNCDLSTWDVSNVKDMIWMFTNCKKFDCDLNFWNVSNVEDMYNMFSGCKSLKNKPSWYKNKI